MNKFVKNRRFRTLLSLSPMIVLLYVLLAIFFGIKNDFMNRVFGLSIFGILPYFYIVYQYKFCDYSKISVWGLFLFILTNIINDYFELGNIYYLIFRFILLFIIFGFSLISFLKSDARKIS